MEHFESIYDDHTKVAKHSGYHWTVRRKVSYYPQNCAVRVSVEDRNRGAEAEKTILDGKHFTRHNGKLFFPKLWSVYSLKPHMFYRQSFMFISYLKHIDYSKISHLRVGTWKLQQLWRFFQFDIRPNCGCCPETILLLNWKPIIKIKTIRAYNLRPSPTRKRCASHPLVLHVSTRFSQHFNRAKVHSL